MNMKKRITAALTAMTLCISLAACGGNGAAPATDGGKEQTAGEKVAAAIQKFDSVKSCSVSMKQDMQMDMKNGADAQSVSYTVGMDMDMFQKPIKAKGKLNIDMGELGKQAMDLYMQESDGQTSVYIGLNGQWMKQSADTEGMQMYDMQQSMDLYLDSASDFKEAGSEQVGGADAVKFTGVIKGESLDKVMQESGMMDMTQQFGAAEVDEEQLKELLSGLGDLPMSVWINADGYPVQYEMDMAPMMSGIMEKAVKIAGEEASGISFQVPKALMTMTVSNFDSVADFELPAETQNAVDMAG